MCCVLRQLRSVVSADLGFHDAAFSVLRAMAMEKADAVLLGGDIAYTAWVKFLDFAASVARAPWMPSLAMR